MQPNGDFAVQPWYFTVTFIMFSWLVLYSQDFCYDQGQEVAAKQRRDEDPDRIRPNLNQH